MDAKVFRNLMTHHDFPTIRKKMKFTSCVKVQLDGAPPHTGKNTLTLLDRSGKQKRQSHVTTQMVKQPAQSPDTDVNDLCVFRSLKTKVRRSQRNAAIFDVDGFVLTEKGTFENTPTCS
eukprot:c27797_g1_i1.p2 GENE.c27797_g1_i1~~c27797_g1_i1.p2  ORF type:complete len:119 (+),score=29.60 c27797_g1_i1:742-1098(+)